ncbi:MAG: SagB/ThcOx family dehydrogenase [Candidatus Omnitrophica bacterium]|nr:SagB/ThcOx family dehydrogenase [Candidatus Omnitrophota bacterium]
MSIVACGQGAERIKLPQPRYKGEASFEEALYARHSVRSYGCKGLILDEISQLLWAAQGKSQSGKRTAPSAHASYPIDVYLVVGKAEGLAGGLYKYDQPGHQLIKVKDGDLRHEFLVACRGQGQVLTAPVSIVLVCPERKDEMKFVYMEAGHIAENVYLQSTALNLGTVVIAGFDETKLNEFLGLTEGSQPLYVMPVGSESGGCKKCQGDECPK